MRGILSIALVTAAACSAAGAGGCASPAPAVVSPGLVLVTPGRETRGVQVDPQSWEYRRNDPPGRRRLAHGQGPGYIEIRTRDHTRTTNGLPRESSSTTTVTQRLRFTD